MLEPGCQRRGWRSAGVRESATARCGGGFGTYPCRFFFSGDFLFFSGDFLALFFLARPASRILSTRFG